MSKKTAIFLFGIFWTAFTFAAPASPLDSFIADREFCTYMASIPENESTDFLARYQTAILAAMSFIRQEDKKKTDTQALFEIKAKCDAALDQMVYK